MDYELLAQLNQIDARVAELETEEIKGFSHDGDYFYRFNGSSLEFEYSSDGVSWTTISGGSYLPLAGGTMTGVIVFDGSQTFDGRDLSADGSKLDGIESGATADQSDSEVETAYNNQVSVVSQAEAEAGTATTVRRWTAQRVKQAIDGRLDTGTVNINHPIRDRQTVANNAAVNAGTIAVGNRYFVVINVNGTEYFFGVVTYNGITSIASNGFSVVSGGGTLSGTTGGSGTINVRDQNGVLYIENRRGGSRNIGWFFFGAD